MKKNDKKLVISYENAISKSNKLSIAKLNKGLSLRQLQLFAFAIFTFQQSKEASFRISEFEKKFNITKCNTKDIKKDIQKLHKMSVSIEDENSKPNENETAESFEYINIFQRISYNYGLVKFVWTDFAIPHINELKNKFVLTDLAISSKFKSSYSWLLYDYLRGHYGYWHIDLSKKEIFDVFSVQDNKSYAANSSLFIKRVLDVAINELNAITELNVSYEKIKEGKRIVAYRLTWSTGKKIRKATENQLREIKTIIDDVMKNEITIFQIKDSQLKLQAIDELYKVKNIQMEDSNQWTYSDASRKLFELKLSFKALNDYLYPDDDLSPLYDWLHKDKKILEKEFEKEQQEALETIPK